MNQTVEEFILNIMRRWLWLIILATLVAGAATYWINQQQPPIYEAKARLIIGPGIDSLNPDLNDLRASAQLMQTYAELPDTWPFLQSVIDDLNLDATPDQFEEEDSINVVANEETQILTVSVRDKDADQAAVIANGIANRLVGLSPSSVDNPQGKLRDQISAQAEKLEETIATSELVLKQLEDDFEATTYVVEQRQIMDQIAEERGRLFDAHNTLARLYDALQATSVNQVKIIEPALKSEPLPSQLSLKMLIGAMSGLILSSVIILAFEYFNRTIRTPAELTQVTDLPLLGTIAKHKTLPGVGQTRLIVQALPDSHAAESYRLLGTKFLPKYSAKPTTVAFSQDDADPLLPCEPPLQSVLISSVETNNDSGEIAANLAVVLTHAGYSVIVVDANLHQPTLDQLFGLSNEHGLADVLSGQTQVPDLISIDWASGLSVLPSGRSSLDSFKLLASTQMIHLIKELQQQADFVFIAAPSFLAVADSFMLSSRVDGIVTVAHSGQTRRDNLNHVIESLRAHGANLVGLILNRNSSNRFAFARPKTRSNLPLQRKQKGISVQENRTGLP